MPSDEFGGILIKRPSMPSPPTDEFGGTRVPVVGSPEYPRTFGNEFSRKLGENVEGLGGIFTDPGSALESLAMIASPKTLGMHMLKTAIGQSSGENAADLVFNAGAGLVGEGLSHAGGSTAEAVKGGVKSTMDAALGKPPGSKLSDIPMNIAREWYKNRKGTPETFTVRPAPSPSFRQAVEELPVRMAPPPSNVPGSQMHQAPGPSGETFTGAGARGVGSGTMHPQAEPTPQGEVFGPKKPPPITGSRSAPLPDLENLKNEMRSAGIPEEGVQNPAIQDLFAKNRKGPGTPPGTPPTSGSGLGTPPPSTPVGEGHFAPGGKAQQIMATNAQVKNLNVASSLRAKGITPEKWLELPLDKQNELIKEAHPGHREYVNNPAPNRPGRGASEGIMDIHKVLSDLWNTLP